MIKERCHCQKPALAAGNCAGSEYLPKVHVVSLEERRVPEASHDDKPRRKSPEGIVPVLVLCLISELFAP